MDCPVPGSGIPAQPKPVYEELFSPLGKKPKTPAETSTVREVRTRVAGGVGTTRILNARIEVDAARGRQPLISLNAGDEFNGCVTAPHKPEVIKPVYPRKHHF